MSTSKAEKSHTTELEVSESYGSWFNFDETFGVEEESPAAAAGDDEEWEEEGVGEADAGDYWPDPSDDRDKWEEELAGVPGDDDDNWQEEVAEGAHGDDVAENDHGRTDDDSEAKATRKRVRQEDPPPFLVVFDINGVLLVRKGSGKKDFEVRPHLEDLFEVWQRHSHRLLFAVWSSMASWNVEALVEKVFGGRAESLAFVWDQRWCTALEIAGMHKPLLRKDLRQLRKTEFREFLSDRVLLVDDDPAKCTANALGTAIHPSSFAGLSSRGGAEDMELRRVAQYLDRLASSSSTSSRDFVLANPFQSEASSWEAADEPAAKRHQGACPRTPEEMLPAASALGWRRMESRSSPGVYYYYEEATGATRVEPPAPWEQKESRSTPGMFYYWNAVTGQTSVEKPVI